MLGREKNTLIQNLKLCRKSLPDESDRLIIEGLIEKYKQVVPERLSITDLSFDQKSKCNQVIRKIAQNLFFQDHEAILFLEKSLTNEWRDWYYKGQIGNPYDSEPALFALNGCQEMQDYEDYQNFCYNYYWVDNVDEFLILEYRKLVESGSFYGLKEQCKDAVKRLISLNLMENPSVKKIVENFKELETKLISKIDYEFSKQKQSEHAENFRTLMRSNGQIKQQGNFGGGSQSPSQLEQAS